MDTLTLQSRIGDTIYVVEDFNSFWGKTDYYTTEYGRVVIKKDIIQGFIVDEDGVHIAENTWDGWVNYEKGGLTLSRDRQGDRKVFHNEDSAIEFVKSIAKKPEEVYGVNREVK